MLLFFRLSISAPYSVRGTRNHGFNPNNSEACAEYFEEIFKRLCKE
jgi:hypothetical protein